ncbi:MAG: hypothetical protein D6711_09915 [Chloroflexi bacterium]|nr:MAG: hypothetical protein D6711_09915 [Chloroflexota bacterium]
MTHDPNEEPNQHEEEPNIHKEDTEELILGEVVDDNDVTVPRDLTTEEIRATDPPLGTMVDLDAETLVDANYTTDTDVPFHLPKEPDAEDEAEQSAESIGNKWVTMPHQPVSAEPTLPGSGGLDPNPDMTVSHQANTVQHMPPVSAPLPQEHQPFQRPADQPRRPAMIPPAPSPNVRDQSVPHRQALPPKTRRRRTNLGCVAVFLGIFVTLCGGMTLISLVLGAWAYAQVGDLLNEKLEGFDRYQTFQSTFIYDRNGEPLYEVFNEGRRTNVDLQEMPQYLIDATIAIEDDSFYNNIGIDIGATLVAFLQYLGASPDENTPGGSTITQQLVRNVLFDPEYRAERSPQRKAEEIMLAIALTARKSKDDILELYLNEIYYGNLAYGAQAASQIFFGKDVGDLTLGEAALLAGLPQAPAELDPLNPDPDIQAAVFRRWQQVLNEMVEEGYITAAERDAAIAEGLRFAPADIDLRAPHFTVYAQRELEELMLELGYSPEDIARGGLQVYTTVDLRTNDMVQQIVANQIASIPASQNVSNGAAIVIKPLTGEIIAMVGSIDYNNDAIDGRVNVTNRPRQPGSTMKPFTYASAVELGFSPGDVIWDTRIRIPIPGQPDYEPVNYDLGVHGPMRMRYALANSYNIPAVQVMRFVGVDYLLAFMERFGVQTLGRDASRYGISLTLGGGEVTLLELSRAYGVFANQGVLVDTTAILCVMDNTNRIIYEYENGCPSTGIRTTATISRTGFGQPVLDPRIAYLITDILNDNDARSTEMGSNSQLYTPGVDTSVKTGTTNDFKDNWTIGYTRNLVVGVWVGNNNGDPMRNTTGLSGAAPIWNRVVNGIYGNSTLLSEFYVDGQLLPDKPAPPAGMSQRRICNVRIMIDPVTTCPGTVVEWFLDTPPSLPDGAGNLIPQQAPQQPQDVIPTSGSYVQLVEPGVYRTVVMPLDPAIASAIQFQVPPGEPVPPPPRYCRVPVELIGSTPGVQELLFIAPPANPRDAVEAERYAQSRGLAFLPTIDCTPELLNAPAYGPTVVTAVITSPSPGQIVSGSIPILGTAQFTPEQALYYKLDIIGGQWADWTTIQEVSYQSVVNGQLGTLPVLPPGNYRLRLVIVGNDGNHLQAPYEVPITVP